MVGGRGGGGAGEYCLESEFLLALACITKGSLIFHRAVALCESTNAMALSRQLEILKK